MTGSGADTQQPVVVLLSLNCVREEASRFAAAVCLNLGLRDGETDKTAEWSERMR